MVGLGAFSWEGRGLGFGGGCRDWRAVAGRGGLTSSTRVLKITPLSLAYKVVCKLSKFGHRQAFAYPDVCLRTDIVSGKALLLGQCSWWMLLPLPLFPKESVGREGRHCVYLPGPLSRERRFTGYIANP